MPSSLTESVTLMCPLSRNEKRLVLCCWNSLVRSQSSARRSPMPAQAYVSLSFSKPHRGAPTTAVPGFR